LPIEDHRPLEQLLSSDVAIPAWWTSRVGQIERCVDEHLREGEAREDAGTDQRIHVQLSQQVAKDARPEPTDHF
jgi:hypothetical protein